MARAMVSPQRVTSSGITNPTYTTIGVDGVEFENTGNEVLLINAPSAGDITFITDATVDGLEINDKTISLSASDELVISNLSKQYYNTVDGTVKIDSTVTDMEIAVLKT